MRHFFILCAGAVATAACGGFTTIGKGLDKDRDGGTDAGMPHGGNGAGGGSGGTATGGKSAGGASHGGASSGGSSHGGASTGGASAGGASMGGGSQGGASSGGSSGGGCKSAGDCAVPAICKVCADGTPSCAQGACVNGQCSTTFPPCPADAGTQCKADFDCPQLGVACRQCPDGSQACPYSKCQGGKCISGFESCPGTTDLKWFATCGGPVCRVPDVPTGAPLCDPSKGQVVGGACSPEGATCDPGGSCQGNLLCTTKDPRPSVGCPISRAKYKQDIEYLGVDERQSLANELQSIPLVRYRYKEGPAREHLGFIIEDVEPSPSVDSQRDQVDLYGYTSMAVAALQQQHAEIEALKREVGALRAALGRKAKAQDSAR